MLLPTILVARGDLMWKGAEMDWRLISAVTLAGASFSMVAFGAYTLRAADAVPSAGRAASPLIAPTLMPLDAGAAGTVRLERGVSFVPAAIGDGPGAAPAAGPASSGAQISEAQVSDAQVAALDGASPAPVANLPVLLQDKAARPSWRWRHGRHVAWKVVHRARFCTVTCEADRKHQVAARHGEERRGAPRIALMLGVGF
jgi:hypothetical protein